MADTWSETLWLLLKNLFLRVEDADIPNKLKGLSVKYLYALAFIFSAALIPSVIILAIGYAYELRWLILIGGFWQAFWLWLLAAALSPFGILHQILKKGFSGSIERYLKAVQWCFISKLFFTFALLLLLPWIKNNPNALPLFIAGAIILGMVTERVASEKFVRYSTMVAMIFITLSFLFPNISEFAVAMIGDIDQEINKPELLLLTWEKWDAGEVECYNQDGTVKVWLIVTPKDEIKLFKKKGRGRDTVYNKELRPMTEEMREFISTHRDKLYPGNLENNKSATRAPPPISPPAPNAAAASESPFDFSGQWIFHCKDGSLARVASRIERMDNSVFIRLYYPNGQEMGYLEGKQIANYFYTGRWAMGNGSGHGTFSLNFPQPGLAEGTIIDETAGSQPVPLRLQKT